MEIRADITLQAVLKSFSDVIIPAIDPGNQLAQEQAQLMWRLLTLLRDRLPMQYEYDRDELVRLLTLGRDLQDTDEAPALTGHLADCEALHRRAGAAPDELVAAIARLRAAISDRVEQLAGRDDDRSGPALRAVLRAARQQHLRERSWLLAQGWEVAPETVPAIDTLISFHNMDKAPPGAVE